VGVVERIERIESFESIDSIDSFDKGDKVSGKARDKVASLIYSNRPAGVAAVLV
jgi:hypothetical protein